ncbi:Spermidine/putrescine-binding periplasmic protein [Mesorhizobium plurifarium]|uniref:Spermidine/putrescine-binding periplasmic protein n=1 Tax=Mesorhizobium plurifarium TaxID=69974 RepID=A0A090GKI2_MESPL|nr:Spermidine/putrescine-binding periplasmic protein [Mesorhizobium sp. SOD10]CDX35477.1 Spermidine/putrescine-binding periplasmic protein [Mesorhizobium plurifarium]
MKEKSMAISRRALLVYGGKVAAGAALLSGTDFGGIAHAASRSLTIATSGGSFEQALKKAMFEPYQKANPDLALQLDTPDDAARLKAMVEAGNVTVDLSSTGDFFGLDEDGQWLEPIDYSVVDKTMLLPGYAMKYRVGNDIENTIICYRKDKFSSAAPEGFKDFFDTTKFPGKRAVWKFVAGGILEAALIADGVAVKDLYPIDVERALKKLDSVKADLIWWDSGAQAQQLITSGEAAMGILWGSRAFPAMDNAPVGVVWKEWLSGGGWFVVPKGAPNKAEAFKALAFFLSEKPQIALTKYLPYGPVNVAAAKNVDAKYKGNLPTDHLDTRVSIDYSWWIKNQAAVDTRFQEWLLG